MTQIQIVCDSPKHPKRIVKIETFTRRPGEGWNGYHYGVLETTTLMGETVVTRDNILEYRSAAYTAITEGFAENPDSTSVLRLRSTLECRLCGPRSRVVFRNEKIDALLDAIASQGVSELSLSLLGKLVSRQG